ncbi:hypothetical protein B5S31_g2382 [[Candida] boidinii]|nr:hypothetical protein B5S31_g2382 [[Candida] boidinii]
MQTSNLHILDSYDIGNNPSDNDLVRRSSSRYITYSTTNINKNLRITNRKINHENDQNKSSTQKTITDKNQTQQSTNGKAFRNTSHAISDPMSHIFTQTEWENIIKNSVYFIGHDVLFGQILTMIHKNEKTSKLSSLTISKYGQTLIDSITISKHSIFYPAILNLPAQQQKSNVRKAMAISYLKIYASLNDEIKELLIKNSKLNSHFDWDETVAGDLASRMKLIDTQTPYEVGSRISSFGFTYPEKLCSSYLVDVIYSNESSDGDNSIIDKNNELAFLLGDQLDTLFDPLTEYSPEQTEKVYKPPMYDPPSQSENDDDILIKSICQELVQVQTNFTVSLVAFLQKYVVPLRVRVLDGKIPNYTTAKLNRIFPPTIDEVTRINCILLDMLKVALPYGSFEILKACGTTLPYFYKAYMRHEAATKNFHSKLDEFLNDLSEFNIQPCETTDIYDKGVIQSIICTSLNLTKIQIILQRLMKNKIWPKDLETLVDDYYNSCSRTIVSFATDQLKPYSHRIFTPTGKILTELASGWPSELQYGWLTRRVVAVFDVKDVMSSSIKNSGVIIIFNDHLLFLNIKDDKYYDTLIKEMEKSHEHQVHMPSVADSLMHSLMNELPFNNLPNMQVVDWVPIDNVYACSYYVNDNTYAQFQFVKNKTGNTILEFELDKKDTSSSLIELVNKAKILNKSQPFHLFKSPFDSIVDENNSNDIDEETGEINYDEELKHKSLYYTAHELEAYESEELKSHIVIYFNTKFNEELFNSSNDIFLMITANLLSDNLVQIYAKSKASDNLISKIVRADLFSRTLYELITSLMLTYMTFDDPVNRDTVLQNNTQLLKWLIYSISITERQKNKEIQSIKSNAKSIMEQELKLENEAKIIEHARSASRTSSLDFLKRPKMKSTRINKQEELQQNQNKSPVKSIKNFSLKSPIKTKIQNNRKSQPPKPKTSNNLSLKSATVSKTPKQNSKKKNWFLRLFKSNSPSQQTRASVNTTSVNITSAKSKTSTVSEISKPFAVHHYVPVFSDDDKDAVIKNSEALASSKQINSTNSIDNTELQPTGDKEISETIPMKSSTGIQDTANSTSIYVNSHFEFPMKTEEVKVQNVPIIENDKDEFNPFREADSMIHLNRHSDIFEKFSTDLNTDDEFEKFLMEEDIGANNNRNKNNNNNSEKATVTNDIDASETDTDNSALDRSVIHRVILNKNETHPKMRGSMQWQSHQSMSKFHKDKDDIDNYDEKHHTAASNETSREESQIDVIQNMKDIASNAALLLENIDGEDNNTIFSSASDDAHLEEYMSESVSPIARKAKVENLTPVIPSDSALFENIARNNQHVASGTLMDYDNSGLDEADIINRRKIASKTPPLQFLDFTKSPSEKVESSFSNSNITESNDLVAPLPVTTQSSKFPNFDSKSLRDTANTSFEETTIISAITDNFNGNDALTPCGMLTPSEKRQSFETGSITKNRNETNNWASVTRRHRFVPSAGANNRYINSLKPKSSIEASMNTKAATKDNVVGIIRTLSNRSKKRFSLPTGTSYTNFKTITQQGIPKSLKKREFSDIWSIEEPSDLPLGNGHIIYSPSVTENLNRMVQEMEVKGEKVECDRSSGNWAFISDGNDDAIPTRSKRNDSHILLKPEPQVAKSSSSVRTITDSYLKENIANRSAGGEEADNDPSSNATSKNTIVVNTSKESGDKMQNSNTSGSSMDTSVDHFNKEDQLEIDDSILNFTMADLLRPTKISGQETKTQNFDSVESLDILVNSQSKLANSPKVNKNFFISRRVNSSSFMNPKDIKETISDGEKDSHPFAKLALSPVKPSTVLESGDVTSLCSAVNDIKESNKADEFTKLILGSNNFESSNSICDFLRDDSYSYLAQIINDGGSIDQLSRHNTVVKMKKKRIDRNSDFDEQLDKQYAKALRESSYRYLSDIIRTGKTEKNLNSLLQN